MDAVVLHKRRQRPRRTAGLSLLGDGLLERARSTSFGLLGLTAALGLGAIALALNQGLPVATDSPLPSPPAGAVHDQVVAKRPPAGNPPKPSTEPAQPPPVRPAPSTATVEPQLAAPSPRKTAVVVASPEPVGQAGQRPSGKRQRPAPRPAPPPSEQPNGPVPEPAAAPVPAATAPPPPQPTATVAAEAVASSHPGQGHAHGKGNGNGPPQGIPPGQLDK